MTHPYIDGVRPPTANRSASRLGPAERTTDLRRLREETFDLLIVGGGITGAGAALDAASRGLNVALVEAEDFASGTSSKSSKLIHGGLRYLEMLDFRLVAEALGERRRLLEDIAPHLVRPVRFVWPLTHRVWERAYLTAGLTLYDTMAGRGAVPRHRQISRNGLQRIAPGFDRNAHYGGLSFFDASEDDARMVLTVVRTARAHGAAIISGARAGESELGADGLRTVQVKLTDGTEIPVRTWHLGYATGPFSDQQQIDTTLQVRPSKGVHIMVPRDRIPSSIGVLTRTEKSVLFIIPWEDHWLIGDTDTDWPYERQTPVASGADIDYLLDKANEILRKPLLREDIVGVFAGLRPLVQTDPNADTTKLSREHAIVSPEPGVSMIAGGKYTTYRVMAKDLVDAAVEASRLGGSPSPTAKLPLLGADGYHAAASRSADIAREYGLSTRTVEHLLRRYGGDIGAVLAYGEEHGLVETIPGYAPHLWAEIRYAFSDEGALSVSDALTRRTRIRIQYRDGGKAIAERTAELAAEVLEWESGEQRRQVADYLRVLRAETAALQELDDESALVAYEREMRS